jgi:hypothetical protein
MATSQRVSRGFHRLVIFLAAIPLLASAPAAPQAKGPTLYVDKIDIIKGEVFVTYSYVTDSPPYPEDVLEVARAQCRRSGYANAVRSEEPTVRQCISVPTGPACVRERATDNFTCAN